MLLIFEMACLRRIAGVSRRKHQRNFDIRRRLGVNVNVLRRIQKRRMQYFGHISRMDRSQYPQIALFGRIHGQRRLNRPYNRWLDNVKNDCSHIVQLIRSYFLLSKLLCIVQLHADIAPYVTPCSLRKHLQNLALNKTYKEHTSRTKYKCNYVMFPP